MARSLPIQKAPPSRRHGRLYLAVGVIALSGLLFASRYSGTRTQSPSDPSGVELDQATPGPRQDVPSALNNMMAAGLPEPTVDPRRVISGGVPPDGIPSIDRPRFERTPQVDWLSDREPVIVLSSGPDARAYPVQILTWHEIVNDTVGGDPVVVTYCPLCNSALAFERQIDQTVFEFGVSGRLYNSSLVMYDRQTESLWSHFVGEAIAGTMTGTILEPVALSMVSWSNFKQAHPDGWVLSRDTGFDRPYGRNPYVGYDQPNEDPFLFDGTPDRQLPAKSRVLGISSGGDALAIINDTLRNQGVVHVEVGSQSLVAWIQAGAASALDTSAIEEGKDVGQTGVFDRDLDGRILTFEKTADGFRDTQTSSTWDVLGRATSGPLAGSRLTAVPHVDTFWFAWAAFQPDTRIFSTGR